MFVNRLLHDSANCSVEEPYPPRTRYHDAAENTGKSQEYRMQENDAGNIPASFQDLKHIHQGKEKIKVTGYRYERTRSFPRDS